MTVALVVLALLILAVVWLAVAVWASYRKGGHR